MSSEELLKTGQLNEAMAALKDEVRKDPSDAKPRIFLFQLYSVFGEWEKAITQLNVACDLDAENLLMAQVCRQLLANEAFRCEVFAGNKLPLIFGEPDEWVGEAVMAAQHAIKGEYDAAATLREKAFEAAPAVAGRLNGKQFEWIADADTRLGPLLEAIIDGRYYWIPLHRVRAIKIDPPSDLRDLVWAPATFRWTNEGEKVGFVPTRYPGSEKHEDNSVRLGRSTFWEDKGDGSWFGLGQRLLATDWGETPLLEAQQILIGSEEELAADAAANPEEPDDTTPEAADG